MMPIAAAATGGGASSARARRLSPAVLAGATGTFRVSTGGAAFLSDLFLTGRFFAIRFLESRFFARLFVESFFFASLLFAVGGVFLLLRVAVALAFLAIFATPYRSGWADTGREQKQP